MERKTRVQMSRGDIDWIPTRECFVRAFYRYSLFKYIIPNDNNREEFLRRYLEANYEVAVRNGNSILLCIVQITDDVIPREKLIDEPRNIIGGVLFVPPSEDGKGWENASDSIYWEAYERFKLKEVDNEAFERVIKYEEWETTNILEKICELGIPMWNGLFCAIDPVYSGSGCGTMNYADCMRIMAQVQKKNEMKFEKKSKISARISKENKSQEKDDWQSKLMAFKLKMIHSMSLLNHRHHVVPGDMSKRVDTQPMSNQTREEDENDVHKKRKNPLVLAYSHSRGAVQFHKKNGFHIAGGISFNGLEGENVDDAKKTIFNVQVLVMDPFKTGRTEEVSKIFGEENSPPVEEKQIEKKLTVPTKTPIMDVLISSVGGNTPPKVE